MNRIELQVCDVEFEVEEGDARYVLCEAAIKHRASVLVVGSRDHGAIKRYFLQNTILVIYFYFDQISMKSYNNN